MTIDDEDIGPDHPGTVLYDLISASGRARAQIARMAGVSPVWLHHVVSANMAVTPRLAVRLGKLFGQGTQYWLRLQADYDAWHIDREVDTSDVPRLSSPPTTCL